ncbi:hypothetical protein OAQ84_01700, partial [Bdellovibrionales bacterium]|nr:hypothetical protein [Bdellovibrionales bacterium]
ASGSSKPKSTFLLSSEQLRRLSPQKFSQYMSRLHMLMVYLEKIDNFKKKSPKKRKTAYGQKIFSLLFNSAWAATNNKPKECIFAGYIGKYELNSKKKLSCHSEEIKKGCIGNNYSCNQEIFGKDSNNKHFCFPRNKKKQATSLCRDEVIKHLDGDYSKYKKWTENHFLKNENSDMKSFNKALEDEVKKKRKICEAVENSNHRPKIPGDQEETCVVLEKYLTSLKEITDKVAAVSTTVLLQENPLCSNEPTNDNCICPEGETKKKIDFSSNSLCSPDQPEKKVMAALPSVPRIPEIPPAKTDNRNWLAGFFGSPDIWKFIGGAAFGVLVGSLAFRKTKTKTVYANTFPTPPYSLNKGGEIPSIGNSNRLPTYGGVK